MENKKKYLIITITIIAFGIGQLLNCWGHYVLWSRYNHLQEQYLELYQEFYGYRQDNTDFLKRQEQVLEGILKILESFPDGKTRKEPIH